jgi:hypothetical protein
MFEKSWTDVTEEDIDDLAIKLAKNLGGWIFHTKVDLNVTVPYVQLERSHPAAFIDNPMTDISPLGCPVCDESGPGKHNH